MHTKKSTLLKITLMVCLGQLAPVYGAAPTFNWTATSSGSDLNVGTNWTPVGPPASGDIANFNSTLPGIDLNPVATAPFTTGEMNFLQNATPFTFTFTNASLNFAGLDMVGITGGQRNPTITLTNTNNVVIPQVSLSGAVSDSFGSAQINVSNSVTDISATPMVQVQSTAPYALLDSGANLSINNTFVATQNALSYGNSGQAQFNALEALDQVTITGINSTSFSDSTSSETFNSEFQIAANTFRAHDGLNVTVTNTMTNGVNASNNYSYNQFGQFGVANQLFSIGNNGTITVSNSGTNSGTDTIAPNVIGLLGFGGSHAMQFGSFSTSSLCAFMSGDNLSLNISNMGVNTTSASGSNHKVGTVDGDQMDAYSFITGNNSQLTFTNSGVNDSTFAHNCTIGVIDVSSGGTAQFAVKNGSFMAGDGLKLVVSNSGTDGSNGTGGNSVGKATGQAFFNSIFSTGDNASIQLSNSGMTTGSTGGTQSIGVLTKNGQFLMSAGEFIAGDGLNFSASNYGQNNDPGGSNTVGSMSAASLTQNQAYISNVSVGNNASFTFTNTGINTQGGSNSVGQINQNQISVGSFYAKDYFNFTATNSGTDSCLTATSGNHVGALGGGQTFFGGALYVQDNATFILSNSGNNTGGTSSSSIGTLGGAMLGIPGGLFTGDGLNITLTNTGNSTGTGNSNSVATNGNLFVTVNSSFFGESATITINNTGSLTEGNSNSVATGGVMFSMGGPFFVDDHFTLTATNSGTNTSSGTGNKVANYNELVSLSNTILGDDATITLSNFGSYDGTDGTTKVATLTFQFLCNGQFTSGDNLTLMATNSAVNPNSEQAGTISSDQIKFGSIVALNDGALIKAVNSGTVSGSLIHFAGNDLNVLGKATFEAINTGKLTGSGILVNQSAGGDIAIVLQDSALTVSNSALPIPFMMGSLTGDASSTATATTTNTGFIIDTDLGVNTTFAGTMNAYNLIKDGPGAQTLAGTTTISQTGLINEGILNVTGTFNGSILTRGSGTLSGSGTVNGTVYDSGIVLPNRTLTVTNFETSGSGILQSNVTAQNGNGLLAVTNNTTLNGGQVLIGSFDGTYLFYNPYTILTSVNPISGTFDSISTVSPLINPVLTYFPNSIEVLLKQNISAAAFNHNQRAVAAVLDAVTNPTLAQSLLLSQLVDLTIPQASEALDSLAGVQFANETFYNETINRQFIRRLYDPIRFIVACSPCYDPCGQNKTLWLEVGGDYSSLNCRDSMYGGQVTAGAHMRFNENFLLGAGVSFEGDRVQYAHHRGGQTKYTGLGALYGLIRDDYYYILADVAYGYTTGNLQRDIHIGSATPKARSHPNHSQVTFYGEMGLDMLICDIAVQPFAGVEVNSYWRNGFHESNETGWGLLVHNRNRTAAYSRLGLHVTVCECLPFRASLDAAWDYRCTELDNHSHNELLSFPGDLDIIGERFARNSFDYAFTLEKEFNSTWSGYIVTTGQIYNRANTFTLQGGVALNW